MTLTLEETSLILSLVALIVTGLGFFASLKFYREGVESQQRVRGLLDRVEAKVEVLRRDVGGMVKSVWDYAFKSSQGGGPSSGSSSSGPGRRARGRR